MKTAIPWIIIVLLLLFIGWQCNVNPKTTIDTHAIDSVTRAKDAAIAMYRDSVMILSIEVAQNDIERNKWQADRELIEKKMTDRIVNLTFSLNKYRTAKLGKDTVGAIINCDEIVSQLDSLYAQGLLYKLTIDSLINNGTERRQIDSSGIAMRDKTIQQLNGQIDALNHFLQDAIEENLDLRKALARNKRGRWLLAALFGLGGAYIGHSFK